MWRQVVRRSVAPWRGVWRLWRVQRWPTRALGPRYRRSRQRIEIDITWACNLRCFNCNRSCEQAPTGEQMSLEQIQRFVQESVAAGQRWERIRVLGGEPTLHPKFHEIIEELLAYRGRHSPDTVIEVVSNGHGDKVRAALAKLPSGVTLENTEKTTVHQAFDSFNVAPVDLPQYQSADFTNACAVTEDCGIGLTPNGYYACAVAGGIDRIVGLDLGRRRLPASDDDMLDSIDAFCRRCGSFKREHEEPVHEPVRSASWDAAYQKHRLNPPKLTRY
jgi:hypothetical protein